MGASKLGILWVAHKVKLWRRGVLQKPTLGFNKVSPDRLPAASSLQPALYHLAERPL